jgi:hypothetical protein
MKLHLTIVLSAVIISAGLVLAARQPHEARTFADDMLPSHKTISRADVIKAMEQLDQAKLLAAFTYPEFHISAFRVMDARATLDGKGIGIFGEATTKEGTQSPLNFSFHQDEFGRWVFVPDSGRRIVLPL